MRAGTSFTTSVDLPEFRQDPGGIGGHIFRFAGDTMNRQPIARVNLENGGKFGIKKSPVDRIR